MGRLFYYILINIMTIVAFMYKLKLSRYVLNDTLARIIQTISNFKIKSNQIKWDEQEQKPIRLQIKSNKLKKVQTKSHQNTPLT